MSFNIQDNKSSPMVGNTTQKETERKHEKLIALNSQQL